VVSGHMGIEDKQLRKTLATSYDTMAEFLTKRLEKLLKAED